MKFPKQQLLISLTTLALLSACANTQDGDIDPNKGTKTGAVGGAAVGLVLGALTGDARLAAKGAALGATAGAAAGAMADYENAHENHRTGTTADAIAKPQTIIMSGESAQSRAEQLDAVLGDWEIDIWSLGSNNTEIQVNASAQAIKQTPEQVLFNFKGLNPKAADVQFDAVISIANTAGYELEISSQASNLKLQFAGEYQAQMNRFNYYPTSNDENAVSRLEMRVISPNFWIVESYAMSESGEQMVQSFRFTRA